MDTRRLKKLWPSSFSRECRRKLPDGTRVRGDIHVLLVGDPGVAKSQLLLYAARLAPKGVYTSGKSTTSAGLTATAIKDEFGDGRWSLEAGALVLADKGPSTRGWSNRQ